MNYYDNNFLGTHRLLLAMQNCDVRTLVFSSSATVYGEPQHLPIAETHPLSATNPYGRSKLFIEDMLRDLHRADPQGVPNNLMPFVAQVAVSAHCLPHGRTSPRGRGVLLRRPQLGPTAPGLDRPA